MKKWLLSFMFVGMLSPTFSGDYKDLIISNLPIIKTTNDEICSVNSVNGSKKELTLDDICDLALKNNPVLRSKEANIRSSESDLTLSKSSWWPEFYLTGSFINSGDTALTQLGAKVELSIDSNKLRRLDVIISELGVESSQESLRRERVWTVNAVKELYYDFVATKKKIELYDQYLSFISGLQNNDSSFKYNKRSKIVQASKEKEELLSIYNDLGSKLSNIIFNNPFGRTFNINDDDFEYRNLFIDKKAIYRETLKQRYVPELLNADKLMVLIKKSTLNYWPKLSLSYQKRSIYGQGGEGYDRNEDTLFINGSWKLNWKRSNALKKRSESELKSYLWRVYAEVNNMIGSVNRAINNFESTKKILKSRPSLEDYPLSMKPTVSSLETIDGMFRQNLSDVDALNNYLQAIIHLNKYVMITDENDYSIIGYPPEMPRIIKIFFKELDIPKQTKQLYINNLK